MSPQKNWTQLITKSGSLDTFVLFHDLVRLTLLHDMTIQKQIQIASPYSLTTVGASLLLCNILVTLYDMAMVTAVLAINYPTFINVIPLN